MPDEEPQPQNKMATAEEKSASLAEAPEEPSSSQSNEAKKGDETAKSSKKASDQATAMTDEEENKLLADEEDLDVIDCYTEDFDSDMEQDFCRKEAAKENERKKKEEEAKLRKETVESEERKEDIEEKCPEKVGLKDKEIEEDKVENVKEKTPEKIAPPLPDDDDEDVIQLCDDDISDTFLDEVSSTSVAAATPQPEISLRVKNEFEKERILSEPLVKQMVIPEICVSDDEDDRISFGSQESLSLQIDQCVEKAQEIMQEAAKKDRAKGGKSSEADGSEPAAKTLSRLNSSRGSESGLGGCQQEDPDVLKLKLDLYQDMGGMDYELDDKTDDAEKLTVVRIKDEPCSPRPIIHEDDEIPTIELTSTDEEVEPTPSHKQYKSSSKKRKRSKKGKSKKKAVPEIVDLGMISSDDSFPIVVDSTVSVDSRRTRHDSEGSEGAKALRNRMVDFVILEESDGGKKAGSHRKSVDTDSKEPPVKKRKKVDPAMIGYRNRKRRKSVGRAASKGSLISISTATSSIPDEDMIVLSANDVLLADPLSIEGGGGMLKNIENDENRHEAEAEESKEELMHSLDLREAIVQELEQEVPVSQEEKIEPAEESLFPVPTTDIALEDMLESFEEKDDKESFVGIVDQEQFVDNVDKEPIVDKEPSVEKVDKPQLAGEVDKEPFADNAVDKEPSDKPVVFHSMSSEEKFLMDSLFADYQKQAQLVPSQEHLETLNTIMDDGKPLVDPLKLAEPIAISYTICDGSAQPATVHMQLDNVAPVEEPQPDIAKVPKAPTIKIIQNYQKYPFQAKPPKKQQQPKANNAASGQKRRGRKKREIKDETDEDYVPSSCRKRTGRVRKPRTKSAQSKPSAESIQDGESVQHQQEHPAQQDHPDHLKFDNGEEDDDGTATTSTVCRLNMPNLEEDLALTSSDDDDNETLEAIRNKELMASTSKISTSSSHEESAGVAATKQQEADQPKTNGGEHMVSKQLAMVNLKGKSDGTLPKRGRPKGSQNKKISDFYTADRKETTVKVAEEAQKESVSQQSLSTKGGKVTTKPSQKRKRKRLTSSSTEDETTSLDTATTTETELELQLSASSIESESEQTEQDSNELEKTLAAADQMDNLQIVISPLTEDKIRKFNKPPNRKGLAKACQTEISGLTWSIDLNQIDFRSEYFEKLRILLNSGARGSGSARSFNGVDIPSRSNLQRFMDSSSPPRQQLGQRAGTNRNSAEVLLFQRAVNSVDPGPSNAEDFSSRQRLERVVDNVRSTFRIPKVKKQASTSPQVVTSSTPHLAAPEDDHGGEPAPSTSRSVDQPQHQSNSRAASSTSRPPQRTIANAYVDDRGEYAENGNAPTLRDRQEARLNIMMQDRFEPPSQNQNVNAGRDNPVNASYMPPSNAENGPPRMGQPMPHQDPRPAALPISLENRSGLPSRAELLNVRRTIRNDVSQPPLPPQQQPQVVLPTIQQPVVVQPFVPEVTYNPPQQNSFSMFGGGYQPTATYSATNAPFNRGGIGAGYQGIDMMAMFNGDMMGMQQPPQQPRGNPNNFTDFLTMLWDQFRQQQQPPSRPVIQPPMQPSLAPLPNMPIQGGPSQLPPFNQFPQMGQVPVQPSQAPPQVLEPQRTSEQTEIICYIFGCIDFLSNRCIKTHCRYPHNLPSPEDVYQKLSTQSRDNIMTTYRYVAGRDQLFNTYFPVYASVMGRNNMRHQLLNTIGDCEQPKRPIQFYKHIVEGLKASGTSPVQAVQFLLEKHTKRSFHQINVLIELILDTGEGIPTFLRMLEEFSNVRDYHYDITSVNRLLEFCVLTALPTNEMATFVCKLMLKVPVGEEQFVDTRVLLEFIQKVRLDPALALDVEDIVKKYGSVVMRP